MQSDHYILVFSAPPRYGILLINHIKSSEYQTTLIFYSEAVICSTAIDQSLNSEIRLWEFDDKTIDNILDSPGELTIREKYRANSSGNNFFSYDDIDDFNRYTENDTLSRSGLLNTSFEVMRGSLIQITKPV